MLIGILEKYVTEQAAPFVAIALFVLVVGASLWLTPRIARWIDSNRSKEKSFYDGMMEQPPEQKDDE